jgi:hypothetical protein
MPKLFVTSIIGKDYRNRSQQKGPKITTILETVFDRVFKDKLAYIKSYYLNSGTTDSTLSKRSGKLIKSTRYYQNRTAGGGVTGKIVFGEDTIYSGMHIGDSSISRMIRPKTGKYLAIPLPIARKADGSLRAEFAGGSLRNIKSLHPIKGTLSKVSKDGQITPYFALKPFVVIPVRVRSDKIMEDIKQDLQYTLVQAFNGIDFTTMRAGASD